MSFEISARGDIATFVGHYSLGDVARGPVHRGPPRGPSRVPGHHHRVIDLASQLEARRERPSIRVRRCVSLHHGILYPQNHLARAPRPVCPSPSRPLRSPVLLIAMIQQKIPTRVPHPPQPRRRRKRRTSSSPDGPTSSSAPRRPRNGRSSSTTSRPCTTSSTTSYPSAFIACGSAPR